MMEGLQQNGNIDLDDPSYDCLEAFRPPDDFVVQRGIYKGPKVVP